MPRLQFIPPQSKHPVDVAFSESYKRKLACYERNYLRVLEPEQTEKYQMKHWAVKSIAQPDHIRTELIRMCKVKLKGGDFEDESGNIVPIGPNCPKVALTYMLHEVVDDPKSREQGNPDFSFPLSSDTYTTGVYKRPLFKIDLNKRGEIANSSVMGGFDCYYIEYTEKLARELLAKYPKGKTFSMSVIGDDKVMRTVWNIDEFLTGSIDDLVGANAGVGLVPGQSYLTRDRKKGGLQRYLNYRAKQLKEGEVDETATVSSPSTAAANNSRRASKTDA